MTELHTDGNDVAGTLGELFGADPTTTRRRCQSCRGEHPLAEHRAYRGAGIVLRCPGCGDLAAVIAELPDRNVISLHGTWSLARTSE